MAPRGIEDRYDQLTKEDHSMSDAKPGLLQEFRRDATWICRDFARSGVRAGDSASLGADHHDRYARADAGEVKIPVTDGEIPAYRALPASGGPFPVVLVVQEIFGVHEHIKDICRRFAKLGYLAIAPEMYARQGDVSKLKEIREIISKVVSKVPDAQVMSDLDAAVAWAKGTGKADVAKLAITGFCWGGRIVWLYSAHNPNLKAGVAWYGRLVDRSERASPQAPDRPGGFDQGAGARALRRSRYREFRSPPSRRCERPSRTPARPPRSCSIPIRRTPSSPTIGQATARTRPRTAGSGCSNGSRNTGSRLLEATERLIAFTGRSGPGHEVHDGSRLVASSQIQDDRAGSRRRRTGGHGCDHLVRLPQP